MAFAIAFGLASLFGVLLAVPFAAAQDSFAFRSYLVLSSAESTSKLAAAVGGSALERSTLAGPLVAARLVVPSSVTARDLYQAGARMVLPPRDALGCAP
ncbi:MAG: hypothetical protein AAF337_08930 [Pseudomonadota bacterium]